MQFKVKYNYVTFMRVVDGRSSLAFAFVRAGCLAFDSLDAGCDIDGAFAIGYRFRDAGRELWTRRFMRFKGGMQISLRAGAHVLGVATPGILSELELDPPSVTFVPALRSSETAASDKGPLPLIAGWCAKQCGSDFVPNLLTKKAHPSLHGRMRSAQDREAILESAGYSSDTVSTPNVFVLDDLITRGSTLCEIARAIKDQNPGVNVYGLALGKNDQKEYLESRGQYSTNDHIPSEWNDLWMRHDQG